MTRAAPELPTFRAPFAPPDERLAAGLLAEFRQGRRGRSPHRCPRQKTRRSHPRQGRRPRRRRGVFARLFALHQRGPGAHGAGRGAVARARRRDRRPADRGQARRRPLARWRRQIGSPSGFGLGLDARHRRSCHSSGRDAGDHPRQHRAAARPAHRARGDAAGDAALGLAFRARADHRGGAASHARSCRVPLFVRHARRGSAHRRRRRQILRRLCHSDRGDRRASRQR